MADTKEPGANTETPVAPQDDSIVVRANAIRDLTMSPTFAAYYANDTQIQTSPWDVRLMFGQIVEVEPEKNRAVILRIADVRLSLEHAKRITKILVQQLAQFEATFGVIPQPPD